MTKHSAPSQRSLKCIGEVMTSKYIAFSKKSCQNITDLCWIPQADSIIHKHVINGLPQCDTIEKYLCMLDTIRRDTNKIEQLCPKSCQAEAYKLSTSRNAVDAFTWVRKRHILTIMTFNLLTC